MTPLLILLAAGVFPGTGNRSRELFPLKNFRFVFYRYSAEHYLCPVFYLLFFLTMLNAVLNPLAIRSCQNSRFALSRNEK